MIKAVIFDIDNTLYSYDENHIYGMEALADILQGLVWDYNRRDAWPATERPDGS